MPCTLRTASALCRCVGQATTERDPGINSAAGAIAQAAGVVLQTCRGVSTRMDAPRWAQKCFLPRRWRHSQDFTYPQDRIEPVGGFTSYVHGLPPIMLARFAL